LEIPYKYRNKNDLARVAEQVFRLSEFHLATLRFRFRSRDREASVFPYARYWRADNLEHVTNKGGIAIAIGRMAAQRSLDEILYFVIEITGEVFRILLVEGKTFPRQSGKHTLTLHHRPQHFRLCRQVVQYAALLMPTQDAGKRAARGSLCLLPSGIVARFQSRTLTGAMFLVVYEAG